MRGTIEKTLAPYKVTRPIARRIKNLSDEEILNGLYWVSDAVRSSQLGITLLDGAQHFANDVLPAKFWMGVEESRTGMTEG